LKAASLLLLALLAAAPAAALPVSAGLPRGEVVERVACAAEAGKSYALYLPAGYTPERKWPIVYAFDSKGHGPEIARLLRTGAERYGWIVASSNDSSNLAPMSDNFALMSALWADTHARFSIDDRRVYALGFSGLVRFAVNLALTAPGSLAGVIGTNGGWPVGQPLGQPGIPFFFTVGDADFAYYELRDLQDRLEAAGLTHRLEIFSGSHQWPPEELFTRSVGWMELQAMKRGLRAKDSAVVEALWSEDLARARSLEAAGQLDEAQGLYAALVRDFAGLRETGEAGKEAVRLAASYACRREREVRRARDQRDREYLERVPQLFKEAPAQPTPDHVSQLLAGLHIPELKKRAKSDPDPDERLSAERVLYAVYIQTGLYLPREYGSLGQYDRAILFLQVASEIDPDVPHIPYRLATAYARKGNRRRALDYLELSAQKGWTDLGALESERAFEPLRKTEQYRRIVNQIRQHQAKTPRTP
jgi:tetratricopeptide (TPR) repeat protein